ncbi:MAG: hypothetical protein ACPGYK_09070 [Flavobacteriales bacterium]
MKDLKDHIKGKLGSDANLLTRQEVQSLWGSISNALDVDRARAARRRRMRLIAPLSILLLIGGWGWWNASGEAPSSRDLTVGNSREISSPVPSPASNVSEGGKAEMQSISEGVRVETTTGASAVPAASEVVSKTIASAIESAVNRGRPASSVTKFSAAAGGAVETGSAESTQTSSRLDVNPLRFRPPVAIDVDGFASVDPSAPMNEAAENQSTAMPRFSIQMYQGPTWSTFTLTESGAGTEQQHNQNSRMSTSWSAGGSIEFNRWHQTWGVGVEWNEFIQQLNYSGLSTVETTSEDAVLQVVLDPLNGDTLETMLGDVTLSSTVHRRIVHHNRLRTIAVPLEWRKSAGLGGPKLSIGAAVGVLVHWQKGMSGLTFTGGEDVVAAYDQANFLPGRLVIAPLLRGYMAWRFKEEWSAGISWRMSMLRHGARPSLQPETEAVSFKGRMVTGNLHVGISRAF